MKVVFFGSDEMALPLLDALMAFKSCKFVGVVSQPNRPHGRGQKIQINPIAEWAIRHHIEVLQPEKPDDALLEWLKAKEIGLVIVMAYGHKVPKNILDLPPMGMWNIHTSLLPRWRGAAPIPYAILNGEKETGVTFMKMVEKMDAGPISKQEKVPVASTDTTKTLREKLSFAAAKLVNECLLLLLAQQLPLIEQNESEVIFTKKIKKTDGQLNFHLPAEVLERQIRAFTPWPGSYFYYENIIIKVGSAVVLRDEENPSIEPGTVLSQDKHGLLVKTKHYNLLLTQLQKEGGKMLLADSFLRGFTIPVGVRLFPL